MPKSENVIQIGSKSATSEENPESKPFNAMNWSERWSHIRESTTVEPLIACFVIGYTIMDVAIINLELEKSCRVDANFTDEICDAILSGNNTNLLDETAAVQLNITQLQSWLTPVYTVVPLVLSLFWGSFSDRHQIRKPFLLLPIIGELFSAIGCIISVVFMREIGLTAYALLTGLSSVFMGGQVLLVVAVFAYIADVSTVEQRTVRIAMLQTVIQTCQIISRPLGGILFTRTGYYAVLAIYFFMLLLGLLYGIFFIKDKLKPRNIDRKTLLLDLFNPLHIKEAVSVLYVKKAGNNRLHIILIMMLFFITSGVAYGEDGLLFFYTNRQFQYTATDYSYMLTMGTLIRLVGNLLGVWLFTKVFKWSDYTIVIVTLLDKMIANIVTALASTIVVFYIGLYVSLFTDVTTIAMRSLVTKIVSQEDLGKAQSFFAICDVLGGAAFTPIYNQLISKYTVTTWPSAFFYAVLIFFPVAIAIIFWMLATRPQDDDVNANDRKSKLEGVVNDALELETQTTRI